MARINANLTYAQPGTDLFIRRDPTNAQVWQVVTGKWEVTDGKRSGFLLEAVLEGGIAKGNLARERATKLHAERTLAKQTA